MANPVKTGDAKLWVYRHFNDQDCQAAEDDIKVSFLFDGPGGFSRPVSFPNAICSIKANPVKTGDAKPWV
jgi:hypothetical protein